MTAHMDSGARCLVLHADGDGQCIRCTCGATVRPRDWQAHRDAEQEDARLKRLARLPEAEVAVIAAAKVMADVIRHPKTGGYGEYLSARDGLLNTVAALRELEGA